MNYRSKIRIIRLFQKQCFMSLRLKVILKLAQQGDKSLLLVLPIKDIEEHWLEWLGKFEIILERLYWYDAIIHLESEYFKTHIYKWESNAIGNTALHNPLPSKIQKREWGETEFKLKS